MGVFLFIDGPVLVCGWVNFPILWPHTPVQMKLKCPPGVKPVFLKVLKCFISMLAGLTLSGPAFSVVRQARGGLRGPDAKN